MHYYHGPESLWCDRQEQFSLLALQPGAPLAYLQWLYFYPQREVSSMPSPSPLLNPWPDYVAHLPELQWQIEENTCRSSKQISLICFYYDFIVIWQCHSPHSGCQSWEFWNLPFFCGLCWSWRPTCPRSLNVDIKKVKDPLNCTVVKATKHLWRGLQILQKRKKRQKRLLAPLSKDRYWLRDLSWALSAFWQTGGLGLFQYGATVLWKNKKQCKPERRHQAVTADWVLACEHVLL